MHFVNGTRKIGNNSLVPDLSRLEIKKVTGEIEITGGKNLLLTVDELKL